MADHSSRSTLRHDKPWWWKYNSLAAAFRRCVDRGTPDRLDEDEEMNRRIDAMSMHDFLDELSAALDDYEVEKERGMEHL